MSLVSEIAQHIHNQGLGTLSTDLFYGYVPAEPDACIAVLDTGGMEPDTELPISNPTFQVLVRSTSYSLGRSKLDQIRDVLHKVQNEQLVGDGEYYYFIFALSEGGHIGRDENARDMFSINFRCKRRDDE
jgi:hypothetical protein